MFEFIADDDLRSSLQSDSEELKKCAEAQAWKAVHVLAGSIVEALLVDQVCAVPEPKRPADLGDPLKADLGKLIAAGQQLGILSERTAHLAKALKSYRNLIHPGRSLRLGDVPTPAGSKVAQALVEMVVADVGKASEHLRGLTADQLLLKLRSDPSVLDILTRLLGEMNPVEIEKLLLTSLPNARLDAHDEWSLDSDDEEILKTCFRKAFERATPQTKAKVCASYARMIREDAGSRLSTYEHAFFRAEYLEFVSGDRDRALVKDRLLGLVRRRPEHAKVMLAGIGRWLTAKEVEAVGRDALNLLLYHERGPAYAGRSIIREIYSADSKVVIAGLLRERTASFEREKREDKVKILQELMDSLESGGEDYDFEDIPF